MNAEELIRIVGWSFNLRPVQMKGRGRSLRVSTARQIAYRLMRLHLGMTYSEIGDFFGARDHSTIIDGCNSVAAKMEKFPDLAALYKRLKDELDKVTTDHTIIQSSSGLKIKRILPGDDFTAEVSPNFGVGYVRATADKPGYHISNGKACMFLTDELLEESRLKRER